jgi:CRISPR-associated protein Csm4
MHYIEIVIRPLSDWMTPWQADTLFGHLAWSIRYEEGEQALKEWLDAYDEGGEPPIILSDGFIGRWLPRPMLPLVRRPDKPLLELEEAIEAKKRKSLRWIDRDALIQGRYDDLDSLSDKGEPRESVVHHNVISRYSHRSLNEDGLYAVEQYGLPEEETTISIYARVKDDRELERLKFHMERAGLIGFGKRKSVGMGRFEVEEYIARDAWFNRPDADAHMWLSHGVPAPHDPVHGCYRIDTKYGKLGDGLATSGNPFKRPFTRLVPGSVFTGSNAHRNWSGRMLQNLAPAHPEVVQYAFALTLPLTVGEDRLAQMDFRFAGGF